MAYLHLIAILLVIAAGRLVFVRFFPYKRCGRCEGRGCKRCDQGDIRRLGARWTARAHLALLRAIDEWRTR